jgi:hypothetical protein
VNYTILNQEFKAKEVKREQLKHPQGETERPRQGLSNSCASLVFFFLKHWFVRITNVLTPVR